LSTKFQNNEIYDSNQIFGNNNTIINGSNIQNISRSEMLDLLESFANSDINIYKKYSLKPPIELNKKLEYNNANGYKELFNDNSIMIYNLSDVISDFEDSELIILKLKHLFIDEKAHFNKFPINGDIILGNIIKKISKTIQSDARFPVQKFSSEQIEQFSISLVQFGISRCKILDSPK
jgi:hypothetical protein